MAEGRLFKPERDFTKEADEQIAEAQELAKVAHRSIPSNSLTISISG